MFLILTQKGLWSLGWSYLSTGTWRISDVLSPISTMSLFIVCIKWNGSTIVIISEIYFQEEGTSLVYRYTSSKMFVL